MGKERSGGLHAGHRARVRQRFLAGGLDAFQDHEVLEFLLFYAVPRRDVNEMAHLLISRFGSLPGVLDATEEELCAVPGVGPHIAHFLTLIPEVMVQMSRLSSQEAAPILHGPKTLIDLMDQHFPPCPVGHILLILTDSVNTVMAVRVYDRFARISAREIASQAANARAVAAVLVERVEDCAAPLPLGRLQAVRTLATQMRILEIPLSDYYTVDDLGHDPLSFSRSGQLLPF